LFSRSRSTHANVFLAAFSAGVTIATMSPDLRASFHQFGELVAEFLKLGALLVFGAPISLEFLSEIAARFITHRFAMNDFTEAYDVFAGAGETGALKIVLTPS